jgi:DNA-binding protein HU-beta
MTPRTPEGFRVGAENNYERLLSVELARRSQITQPVAEQVIQDFLAILTDRLLEEGRVMLRGFGVLKLRYGRRRIGRNPYSGTKREIPPKFYVNFTTGERLYAALPASFDQLSEKAREYLDLKGASGVESGGGKQSFPRRHYPPVEQPGSVGPIPPPPIPRPQPGMGGKN